MGILVPNKTNKVFDVVVVGGGLAGLTAALALSRQTSAGDYSHQIAIALISPKAAVADIRTTALLGRSVSFLKDLGVWQQCRAEAAPLVVMRILDGTSRLWRAPAVEFKAAELDLEAFGYNIANHILAASLLKQISDCTNITLIDDRIESILHHDECVELRTGDKNSVTAKLVIAADGKNSLVRQSANITTRDWSYPQSALAVNLSHTVSHQNTSTEFHTETGPFTLVPMASDDGSHRCGLVWVMPPGDIETLLAHPADKIERMIEDKMQSLLGKVRLVSKPQVFPLSGMIARQFAARRVALVGDAAHVLPPIGAQGFNLGLRDVQEIATLAGAALRRGSDPGSASLLATYNRKRALDIATRTGAVDLLNRSLLSDFLPIQAIRGLGLFALARIPLLRNILMRQGLS